MYNDRAVYVFTGLIQGRLADTQLVTVYDGIKWSHVVNISKYSRYIITTLFALTVEFVPITK